MMSVKHWSARLAALVAAVAAKLVLSGTAASATTNTKNPCGGTVRLTVSDGPGNNKIRVTQYVNAFADTKVRSVARDFTWRNQRSGATGRVSDGSVSLYQGIWSQTWTVTTGPGDVVVTWGALVNTDYCLTFDTMQARAIAR
jgi:hypothetical protein